MISRTPKESQIENHVYKIFPNDLNAHKSVFGGQVMAIADRLALVVAERHSGHNCVTASVDSIHFMAPARAGETLLFSVSVNRAWNTSMEIGVRVEAENSFNREQRHIVSAYFCFVALDDHDKPTPVPALKPETKLEKRRYEAAELRRQALLATKQTLKELKERS